MERYDLFTGERIRFVAVSEDFADIYAKWSHDADYIRCLDTDIAVPRTTEYFQSTIKSIAGEPNVYEFGIKERANDKLIGFIALHSIEWNNRIGTLSIGIGDKEYRNNGYGTEAIKMMLRYAFRELNLNRVGLDVIANNYAAINAYKKAGFIKEGALREAVFRDGEKIDRIYMGILFSEWKKMQDNMD